MIASGDSQAEKSTSRGFTLIELMIVVVIMGVLATLAIYSVVRYVRYTKTGEAREIVASIMAGQKAYRDEVGAYLDITGGISSHTTYYPPRGPNFDGTTAIMWGGTGCTGCLENFNTIGVIVEAPVLFSYASTTYAAGTAPPTPSAVTGLNPTSRTSPTQGFVVVAASNLDSAADDEFTYLVGTNFDAYIYSHNVGE